MSTDLAYAILNQLGRAKRGDDSLTITGGDDPVFKTPWRIAHAGSAALGAVGLAVSDLWRLRTGKPQAVNVDRHAAAMSLRSNTYVLQNGKRPVSWDPLAGHYPTRDGRTMFLHTNHPHHRAGALRIAGAATDTKEALAAAVAKWDGLAIEEAIAAGDCVGGLSRSREEWNAHPHGIAIAKLPLIDMVKIGEAPAEPLPKGERPLSGVRALDLTRVLAGPTSGRVLAENGADVLHIAAPHLPYQTEILMDTGHGKRCAWVDLTQPAGVETMAGLLRGADIFTQGYRPGTIASRGFSPEQAAALRPGIVCVSICAYGHEGPAPRLRFDRAERDRPCRHARLARQAAQPAGAGPRLHRGLSRRAGRHGRPRSSHRTRRLVAGARLPGPGRALAGEPRHRRRQPGCLRAARGRALPLPHGKRRPVRPSAASKACHAVQRDSGLLRQARRATRHLTGTLGLELANEIS